MIHERINSTKVNGVNLGGDINTYLLYLLDLITNNDQLSL